MIKHNIKSWIKYTIILTCSLVRMRELYLTQYDGVYHDEDHDRDDNENYSRDEKYNPDNASYSVV